MKTKPAAEGITEPAIVGETSSFVVVYKPPRIHSAPLGEMSAESRSSAAGGVPDTLLDFVAKTYPEVRSVRGWKPVEGGLVHRLDYDTRGLLLIARTQAAMDALRGQQEQNLIVKEYAALSAGRGENLPGFPPCMFSVRPDKSAVIESAFRPYGKGRKAVRPVLRPGLPLYQTEIVSYTETDFAGVPGRVFRLRISRGYRHQIRSHLAWTGWPIINDVLYGGVIDNAVSESCLALCAEAVSFTDPVTGRRVGFKWGE